MFDFCQAGEVVGGEDFAVPEREGNFAWVAPPGGARRGPDTQSGLRLSHAAHGRRAPGGRPGSHEPKAPGGATGRLLRPPLRAPAPARGKARRRVTPPHAEPAADLPGGQVLQGAAALGLRLDPADPPRGGRQTGRAAPPRLATGLFSGAAKGGLGAAGVTWPGARLQLPPPARLLGKGGITGKEPILVPPGVDCLGGENPPPRARTARFASRLPGCPGTLGGREPTQGEPAVLHRCTRSSFDAGLLPGGTSALASTPRRLGPAALPQRPAPPPVPDCVRRELHGCRCATVGEQRSSLQEHP